LAAWVAGTPRIRRVPALALAKSAMKDVVACMIAGGNDPAVKATVKAARGWGEVPSGAMVGGVAAHALDYDDNFHPQAGHATAVLAPALFALAGARGASGHQVLDAYIVGLEVLARVGEGVNLVHYQRGWHSTSTLGAIGAAAACARLLGLRPAEVGAALSVGFSMAGGSKLQFGTMAKPVHAGLAAMHGVMAADLAARGITAHPEPLDGPWSFRDLFAGPGSHGYDAKKIGRPLAIEQYGLKAKVHPGCASTHCAVDAVIALRNEFGIAAKDVESVDVLVNRMSFDNLMYSRPVTEMQARFSMQYCIALALLHGRLALRDFTLPAVKRPEMRRWLPRIAMRHTKPGQELPLVDNGREPGRVSMRLKDGRKLERYVQYPRGVLQAPMSAGELDAKLADCARGRLAPPALRKLGALLDRFEDLRSLGVLSPYLRTGPRPRRLPSASRAARGRR
jgi:2-methylcitrate dehydratase PrpD